MTLRTWLSAALVVGLISISSSSFADSRMTAQRYQPPARMEPARAGVTQARNARAQRAQPAPAPARAKQARLEPKPPSDAARQSSQAAGRTARGRH